MVYQPLVPCLGYLRCLLFRCFYTVSLQSSHCLLDGSRVSSGGGGVGKVSVTVFLFGVSSLVSKKTAVNSLAFFSVTGMTGLLGCDESSICFLGMSQPRVI